MVVGFFNGNGFIFIQNVFRILKMIFFGVFKNRHKRLSQQK